MRFSKKNATGFSITVYETLQISILVVYVWSYKMQLLAIIKLAFNCASSHTNQRLYIYII